MHPMRFLVMCLCVLTLAACAPASRGMTNGTFISQSPPLTLSIAGMEPKAFGTINAVLAATGYRQAPLTYLISEHDRAEGKAVAIVIVAETPGGWRWKQVTPSGAHLLGISHRVQLAGRSFNAISFRYQRGQDCFGISKDRSWLVRRFTRLESYDTMQVFLEYREYYPDHATADKLREFEERAQQAFELSFEAPSKPTYDVLPPAADVAPLHLGALMGQVEKIPLPLPKTNTRI